MSAFVFMGLCARMAEARPPAHRNDPWRMRETGRSADPERVTVERFTVVVSTFSGRAAADALAQELRAHFDDARVDSLFVNDSYRYRVLSGKFIKEGGAKSRSKALTELGYTDLQIQTVVLTETVATEALVPSPYRNPIVRREDGGISTTLLGRPLIIGGEYRLRTRGLVNFALGRRLPAPPPFPGEEPEKQPRRRTDTFRFTQQLKIQALWKFHEKAALFIDGRFNHLIRDSQSNRRIVTDDEIIIQSLSTNEVRVLRGETYLFVRDLFDIPASMQIGRQRFRDKREWWWDANLDGVRLYQYGAPGMVFEVGLTRELAQLSPDDEDIDVEDDDVLRIFGHYAWNYAPTHRLDAFALYHRDDSGQPPRNPPSQTPDRNRDELDQNLWWLGVRGTGKFKPTDEQRIRYWLDGAVVNGEEELVDFDDDQLGGSNKFFKKQVHGWAVDLGASWSVERWFDPTLTFGYAVGSGNKLRNGRDEDDERFIGNDSSFRQTGLQDNTGKFRGVTSFRYYGELFRPELSNMHIGTIGFGFPILKSSSVDVMWHIYEQVVETNFVRDGEIRIRPNGAARDLGQEIDIIVGLEEWDTVSIEIVAAGFRAGDAYGSESGNLAGFFDFRVSYDF